MCTEKNYVTKTESGNFNDICHHGRHLPVGQYLKVNNKTADVISKCSANEQN